MEEPPARELKYDRYFFINRSKDGKLGFIRNYKAIDKQLEKCGFFLIAETDFAKSTAEILTIYRQRDVIEKSFDSLKNELDMKRLRCHSSESVNGKLFVSFITLIVRSYMMKSLSLYMQNNNYTLKKILLELDKIKCLDLKTHSKPRLLNPVSKKQRDIFEVLEIPIPN